MVKDGFYEDGIFRFIIEFSEKFPKELPSITFKSRVHHPLINANGQLDLKASSPVAVPELDLRGRQAAHRHPDPGQVDLQRKEILRGHRLLQPRGRQVLQGHPGDVSAAVHRLRQGGEDGVHEPAGGLPLPVLEGGEDPGRREDDPGEQLGGLTSWRRTRRRNC